MAAVVNMFMDTVVSEMCTLYMDVHVLVFQAMFYKT